MRREGESDGWQVPGIPRSCRLRTTESQPRVLTNFVLTAACIRYYLSPVRLVTGPWLSL